jgi:hypothetical protein
MKRISVFLLSCAALMAAPRAARPGAAPSRTVYVMAMGSGLDQFLANHLAQSAAIEIVTDPKLAGAVITDRIGQAFERRMDEWYPAPEPRKEEAAEGETSLLATKAPPVGTMSSFGRGKGNIFLVDTHNRRVIWSTYEKLDGSAPQDMDRTASRIAGKLNKYLMTVAPPAAAPQPQPEAAPKPTAPQPQPAAPPAPASPEKKQEN